MYTLFSVTATEIYEPNDSNATTYVFRESMLNIHDP